MLPLHRRRERPERAEKTTTSNPHGDSLFKQLVRFVIDWIKVSWKDIIAMAILGGAALGIYQAPYAATRNFPITFDTSGDIVYPQFAYPSRGWVISPALSGVLSVLVPIIIIIIAQIRIRSFWDCNNAILGLLYSVILSTLFQVIIKQLIGGFRPIFLDVCQPDPSLANSPAHNTTGLNAVGFRQVMYTAEICTNPDKAAIKTAMTSFPSGHATTAFAGLVFLFLWLNAKLKVWANFQPSFYWLALLLAPLLGAALQACALTVDQAHNWYDILAGAVIGTVVAFMSYRVCYAAVWDWRYNHVPLTRRRVFDYAAGAVTAAAPAEYMERALFVRKLGWGRRKRGGRRAAMGREKARVGSTASSATYARNGSADVAAPQGVVHPNHHQGLPGMHPDPAVRTNEQWHGRGEQMV